MNKKRLVASAGIGLFSLGLSAFLFIEISKLKEAIAFKKHSLDIIEDFVGSNSHHIIINQAAYDALLIEKKMDAGVKYSYRAPEGFEIVSYSSVWNEAKLEDLYKELKQNKHGEEINLLYRIIINARFDQFAAGTHQNGTERLTLKLNFPAFPDDSDIIIYRHMGTINLYDGDVLTQVKDMAHVLSHEYGHHFTFHHFFKNNDYANSDYAKLRSTDEAEFFMDWSSDTTHYYNNHHWYLIEVAANDYLQLMGSPLTQNIENYRDINDVLRGKEYNDHWRSKNASNHANPLIPTAYEVEGLADYFYQFVEERAPKAELVHEDFDLTIQKGSSSHDSARGPLHFTHYKITWDDVYDNAIYTLVTVDENGGNLWPIKTVYPGQSRLATIGTVSYQTSNMIYWQYDTIDQGTRYFIVTAVLPDGSVYRSNPLKYTFK